MPAPASADTAAAAVRVHFALTQQELAQWLGVSEAQAGHLDTGRRGLTPDAAQALAPPLPRPSWPRPSWPRPKPRRWRHF